MSEPPRSEKFNLCVMDSHRPQRSRPGGRGISISLILTLLALGGVLLAAGVANAQPRGPTLRRAPQDKDALELRANKLTELDVWLRRLTGRFRYTGEITNNWEDPCLRALYRGISASTCPRPSPPIPTVAIQGDGDCEGIGSGPGVHCVINASWKLPPAPIAESIIRDPWLNPGVILFGVDSEATAITLLQVSSRSIAEQVRGVLRGDVATFRLPCKACSHTMRIIAPSDGKSVQILIRRDLGGYLEVRYHFRLERMPQSVASER